MVNSFTTKYDFRNAYTEQQIKNTFLALNSNSEIGSITVRDICREAGISRSTFYRHFPDIYAVIEDIEKEISMEFRASLSQFKGESFPDFDESLMKRQLRRWFHNCRFRRVELLTLLDSGKYPASYKRIRNMVYDILVETYSGYCIDRERSVFEYYMNYVAGTIIDLIVIWLRENSMSYDDFLSIYIKVFKTDIDLLLTIAGEK